MRTPLEKTLRSALERTTLAARDAAETAARDAFAQLGVQNAKAPDWLSKEQSALRRAFRARAKALGGERASDGSQKVAALVEEVAYEQWNRMVFARFLAENDLLIYEDAIITLADCAAIAEEMNLPSAWDVAAESAAKMLPNVFRPDSLSFKVKFAPDKVKKLESLVESLDSATFQASDSLGWIYQFWQTRKKAAVNASEVKIGADELAPVTQLFTEPYMVAFLLDNSLGAWYAAKKLKGLLFASEAEARDAVATKDIPLKYLRLVPAEGAVTPRPTEPCEWKPAAGSFEKWPDNLAEFSMLDPCCGSGHFAVAALLMLVPMRMELEGLDARTAVDKVLAENIHALELDRRCVEIAAFAVALEAWRYPNAGGYRPLPRLNIACDGIAPTDKRDEWLRLARRAARKQTGEEGKLVVDVNDESLFEANLVRSMGALWDCFQQAPILGSLISPDLFGNDLWQQTDYNTLADVLAEHLDKETVEERETSIAAQGIIQAMQLLGRKYTLVATNVPYLGRRKQNESLKDFCERYYEDAKTDLATVFLERCLKFSQKDCGCSTIVLPQNWLYQKSYKAFRENMLKSVTFNIISQLGEGGFDSPAAAGALVILLSVLNREPYSLNAFYGIDASTSKEPDVKAEQLRNVDGWFVQQAVQKKNPESKITIRSHAASHTLSFYASSHNGMHGGDSLHYRFCFWEIVDYTVWHYFQGAVGGVEYYSGRTNVFYWANNGAVFQDSSQARIQGELAWGKHGIAMSMTRNLRPTLYGGEKYDICCTPLILKDEKLISALWCYCSSPEYTANIRKINQSILVTSATFTQVPFDLERWQKVAAEKYPNGLPAPFTDDPTQWIFHGHPCGSVVWDEGTKKLKVGEDRVEANVLHVAVARLLGYRWPSELDEKMELADEMRWVMKRNEALEAFVDNDGIVCIPALNGEESAASRLMALLKVAYGDAWSAAKLEALMESVGAGGRTLEEWLRKDFFLQHSKLFGSRPFIWQIWDGLRDGFSVLVNYHKLDRKGLETLIYSYLGDWITRQTNDVKNGVEGAGEKLDRATELKGKLEKILEGEAPYDIFVRWKALKDQPMGWNPDLNDGVRLNIRPFFEAGVLREKAQKLNIKWAKDRGKDVPSAPWYAVFHGDRINDHHTTLAEKKVAREGVVGDVIADNRTRDGVADSVTRDGDGEDMV